jgi:hypothetical protein
MVGASVVGTAVDGSVEGTSDGCDGTAVVGVNVGPPGIGVGNTVGGGVGSSVGLAVGAVNGEEVGLGGKPERTNSQR